MLDLEGARVLVTGGAGFIGSHTVNALVKRGAKVAIIDSLIKEGGGRRSNVNTRALFYEADIFNGELGRIYDNFRPDYVYHFAHFVLVPKSLEEPLHDIPAFAGSVALLKRIRDDRNVKKVVIASSGFLYGNTPNMPVKETEPVVPIVPYAITKQAIEHYARVLCGGRRAILRYAAVYGPGQTTGAMADYIRQLAAGRQADIWGDGTKTRDYVYVGDVVRANLLALELPDSHPDPVFNIGTGMETSLNKLYWEIARHLGVEAKPVYHPDRPGEQMRYCLDVSKARRELGWEPQTSLVVGLKETIDAAVREVVPT